LPGLTRQSIFFETSFGEEGWMPESSPGMTVGRTIYSLLKELLSEMSGASGRFMPTT
jgi:hypothetical protein